MPSVKPEHCRGQTSAPIPWRKQPEPKLLQPTGMQSVRKRPKLEQPRVTTMSAAGSVATSRHEARLSEVTFAAPKQRFSLNGLPPVGGFRKLRKLRARGCSSHATLLRLILLGCRSQCHRANDCC